MKIQNHIIDKIPEFTAERNKVNITNKVSITDNQLTGNSITEYNGESVKEDELDIDKYNDFKLLQDGRSADSALLKYKE